MPDRHVLDTSAIVAFTDQEEGGDTIEGILDVAHRNECQLEACAISRMELYYVALQEKGEDEATKLVTLAKAWLITWVYPDEHTLLREAIHCSGILCETVLFQHGFTVNFEAFHLQGSMSKSSELI